MAELKVVIACQGGGSHAAFGAGVLQTLFSKDYRDKFKLLGVSGTSGGAMCAALTWAGLATKGPDDVIARLAAFWQGLEARDPQDVFLNLWGLTTARLPISADISPYLYEPVAAPTLTRLLHRHLRLEEIDQEARKAAPTLMVGATDILNGERVIFGGQTLEYDDLIASAAVPPLFRAVHVRDRMYWDGLFSTNPPVRDLAKLTPDEMWVIQINPTTRAKEPRDMADINDRRNELAGNLSLSQELYFIDKMNELIGLYPDLGTKPRAAGEPPYRHIKIRIVSLALEGLDLASKLDRSPTFIQRLLRHGRERAHLFFDPKTLWPASEALPKQSARPKQARKAKL